MAIYFGHKTAERLLDEPIAKELLPAPDQGLERCQADKRSLSFMSAEQLKGIPKPYDVLVSSPSEVRSRPDVSCHLCQADLPFGSFLELAHDVYVASPALCFVQRAQTLSLANTVVLGARFCGGYALDRSSPTGIRERPPLTTLGELGRYTSLCHRLHGIKRARRALPFIMPNSASPMESICVLVFCLPVRLYGFGLPYPKMNYEIPLKRVAKRLVPKDVIRIDAYWENFAFGLEYQGKYAHSAPTDIACDIARQLAAESMHIELQAITVEQLCDGDQRLYIARKIANRLGARVPTDKQFMAGNQRLVDDLLYQYGAA